MWDLFKHLWLHRERCLVVFLIALSIVSLYLPPDTSLFVYRRINRSVITPFQIFLDRIEMYTEAVNRSEELWEENIRLSLELNGMRMIEEENIRLRTLLDFSTESGVEFIASRVIGYNLSGPLSSFVVDKGSDDQVKRFLPVLTPEGLVGKVAEVDKRTSVVELYSSIGFSVSGMVIDCGEVGIVTARGEGKLFLEGLNLRTEVKAGDQVVSSGLGGIFPVGIPVGIIQSVELNLLGVHKVASVIPQVRLDRVKEVFILADSRYVRADPLWITRSTGTLSSLWNDVSSDSLMDVDDGEHPEPFDRVGE